MPFRILFLRILPWLTAMCSAGLVLWQWGNGRSYPWPVALSITGYIMAAAFIAWRRLSWRDALEKLGPSTLSLMILGSSFLLVETSVERWIVSLLFVGTILLVLELLFLLAHDAAHYPVNGLSRVNLTLVPVGGFYLAFTLTGLLTFIRIPWWMSMSGFAFYTAIVYWLTCHPTADHYHHRRWFLFGGCVGLHVGLLTLLLPVGMAVQGALAALLLAFPLRVRRYAFQPVPSSHLALAEGAMGGVAFFSLLLVSRWA